MEKLKVGIIGCGKVAHLHAKALKEVPEALFSCVYSRSIDKANNFASEYGVKAYDNLDEMFAKKEAEVVIICTPHPNHAEVAIKAAKAGVHVLVEKPLASSLEDCDAMINAAKENSIKIGMVSQRRFYPPVQRVKQAIDDGKIGRPILGTVNIMGWRDEAYYTSDPWRGKWEEEGGGVLVNQAPHQIDILQWFMGPVDEIFGYWGNLNHPYIEVEDTAVAVIRFKNGGLGNMILSNSVNPALYGKVHIHGENGASIGVQTDGGAMFIAGMSNIAEPPLNDLWTINGEEEMLNIWRNEDTEFFGKIDPMVFFFKKQIENFLKAIINGTKPLIDGEDGRKTVEIFTGIYRAQRDRKPVKFPLVPENKQDFDGRIK
jgi:UDP-N-acetyl-2-amino-2-deoxyglucuronate dehydrogenase